MASTDALFSGSIAELYDRHLVPMLFVPYAEDLAGRVASASPRDILETAAGTGVVTAAIAAALPEARIVATDLNPAMLERAARRVVSPSVSFQPADAQALPFADASFDAVVCQFGAMFFPDRVAAYREVRRVLRPGGRFLFNVWDRIERNGATALLADTLADLFPDHPPDFFRRVPFGYHDKARVEADLRAAGFERIKAETVEKRSRLPSARDAAIGLVQGSPLRNELETLGEGALARATDAVAAALAEADGPAGLDAEMSAHVFVAAA